MSVYFKEKTWEELQESAENNAVVVVPVGQVEEHGAHLPVKTDAFIAEKICEKAALEISDEIPVIVTPVIWSGYSTKEVTRWPGCLNLRIETFIALVYDACFSLISMGFKKIVLVSTHGNHTGALEVVTRKIADDTGIYMALTVPTVIAGREIRKILEKGRKGSCHGGEYETSLMLYLDKNSVRTDKITSEDILNISFEFQVFISTWGLQKSRTGIYGDPAAGTEKKGRDIFEAVVGRYKEFLKRFFEGGSP